MIKTLAELLYKVPIQGISGRTDIPIQKICFDSRKVQADSVFIAIKGECNDGHDYIDQAIKKGAKAIVAESGHGDLPSDICWVETPDTSEALSILAGNFYDNPSHKIKLVGITGTNGKTTTSSLLFHLYRKLGYNVGLISTIKNRINEEVLPTEFTTPDALQINALLSKMIEKGCAYCFMEVSSHAIVQKRVGSLHFTGAVFTNITHDHLDYHKTFESYIYAKKKLFDQLRTDAFALVNVDDKRGRVMLQNTVAKPYTFGLKSIADYKAKILDDTLQGLHLKIENHEVWFKLVGVFNAYNLLTCISVAHILGENLQAVLQELSNINPIEGRFEQIIGDDHKIGIVDYAHTPDALKNVLQTIHQVKEDFQKIITIIGCGGNRDASKRPLMAKIACSLSDKVIITSDNPRNEDPSEIINDMLKGVGILSKKKILVEKNREEAIKKACGIADTHDVILLAGKGHETYQEIKGEKFPFDDRKILLKNLRKNK